MNVARWEKINELFDLASGLAPDAAIEDVIRSKCDGDESLYREISAILKAAPAASGVLSGDIRVRIPLTPSESNRIGDYELLDEIGEGGMGIVYRARQVSLDREVAVKILPWELARSPRRRERFEREAKSAARLTHPNIVAVHSFVECDDRMLLVMEHVAGRDLERELAAQRNAESPPVLPPFGSQAYRREIIRIVREIAGALAYAHRLGIVHRDVKPSNVLIDSQGVAKICDFGLAHDDERDGLTRSRDGFFGTLPYASPERLRNPKSAADPRADVYALGVVLFEALTLRRPHDGETAEDLAQAIESSPEPSLRAFDPSIPRPLEIVAQVALAKDPAHRYPNMEEFRADLERTERGQPIHAVATSVFVFVRSHVWRHRIAYAATLLAATLLIGAMQWARWTERTRRGDERADAIARSWENQPSGRDRELIDLRGGAQSFLAEFPDHPKAESVRSALEYVLERGEDSVREGVAEVDSAMQWSRGQDERKAAPAMAKFFSGLLAIERGRALLGEQADEQETPSLETYFPRIRIVAEGDLTVWIREIDPIWGEARSKRRIEDWKDREISVPPGLYRIDVIRAGVGHAEFTRDLPTFGGSVTIAPQFVLESEVRAGMVEIPAGPFWFGAGENPQPWLTRRQVDLPRYWIDPKEVTNAEYKAFLEAHPGAYRSPFTWEDGYPERFADHPVYGVSFPDAQAYAEWRGKRIPTWQEWEKAARGISGFAYPWGDEPGDLRTRANIGRDRLAATVSDVAALELTASGATFAFDRSPFGAFDMLGNVREWTESVFPTFLADRVTPYAEFSMRVVKGAQWDTPLDNSASLRFPTEVSVHHNSIGFRCVVSDPEILER